MTNSGHVSAALERCQCRGGHAHGGLDGGRPKKCQEYPRFFCELIVTALESELADAKSVENLMELVEKIEKDAEAATPPHEDDAELAQYNKMYEGCQFVDDISGSMLGTEAVLKARQLEMQFFRRLKVYTKVKRQPWMKVISTKWIDTNKGDQVNPNLRSRLVGRELNLSKQDGLFAGTPPLESLRYIMSMCASRPGNRVMAIDIKRAYFYARATRPIYMEIPAEDRAHDDSDKVGALNLSLYGTRDAAVN